MKINTKTTLKTLAGDVLKTSDGKDFFLSEALGNILVASETGGKYKLYTLATSFATSDEVEVDGADLRLIKDAVESTKVYNALISGQLLQMLEEKTEAPKKK